METNGNYLLSLILIPLTGSGLVWFVPKKRIRLFSLIISFLTLLAGLLLYSSTDMTGSGIEHHWSWLNLLGIDLNLKFDGVSSWFVLLTGLVSCVVHGMRGEWLESHSRVYAFMGLFLVFSLMSAFLSTNLIFFYLTYESVFVPMIFMVGIWGKNAKAASVFKFFLMSFLGSILMLVSIFYLTFAYYQKNGVFSSNLNDLLSLTSTDPNVMLLSFIGFFLAFSIKVPMFPFHGWLRDVYVNAPGPATIWMSAVLSKLGVYGFIRFIIPLFSSQMLEFQGALLAVSAFTIIYSALLAYQSKDPKGLLAYSSISHLGFVMLGVFSLNGTGQTASVALSISHGLTSTLLFFLYELIQERKPGVDLENDSGMARNYPILFTCLFIGVLSGVSLPGTFNFIGEFMVLIHAYPVSALCTIISTIGVIFGAVYMLKFYQKLGFGVSTETILQKDIHGVELAMAVFIIVMIIYFGFQPAIFLQGVNHV